MASLYKNNGVWYISCTYNSKRKSKSLKTSDIRVAKRLKPHVESQLLLELSGVRKETLNLDFPALAKRFLKTNNRAKSTQELYEYVINSYLQGKSLPSNPNTKAIFIRTINACWNWGLKQGLIDKADKLDGEIRGPARQRVFTKEELELMFNEVKNEDFNAFVRFAYYTGARSGEIRHIQADNIKDKYLLVTGKTGERIVKISTQAGIVLKNQNPLWAYTKNYVSHKFKKEVRRLGIKDARFHDLRRTFGYNLIKQGISIYKVSKLLGHKSVTTTERHYAPLLTTEIEDFVL